MIRVILLSIGIALGLIQASGAQEPVAEVWLRNPGPGQARLDVTAVEVEKDQVKISSAGVSTYYFGPFQSPSGVVERPRNFRFTIPRYPAPAKLHQGIRPDAFGVFVNGIPIFNQTGSNSYRNQNIWHQDEIALSDNGQRVSNAPQIPNTGRESSWGLIDRLMADSGVHSPIIGFAFDGYPIYGPYGEVSGRLQHIRSSYRLRQITTRKTLPDGTELLPGQEGPPVSREFPLGYFAEDYEYVPGSGELDEFNGRFCKTPEYPGGTYAYFLSTSSDRRLAFPYLGSDSYFGNVDSELLNQAMVDLAGERAAAISESVLLNRRQSNLVLTIKGSSLSKDKRLNLSFEVTGRGGTSIRYLEYQHERPLHLIVVSEDLAEFDHIHPSLKGGNRYEVEHTFKSGGRYKLFADFAAPGRAREVVTFIVEVAGAGRPVSGLAPVAEHKFRDKGIELALMLPGSISAGTDVDLGLIVKDIKTGGLPAGLQPFLGAWAHFIVIDESGSEFIHIHPQEELAVGNSLTHEHVITATPPDKITGKVNFEKQGLYRLWAQVQVGNDVITGAFDLEVKGKVEKPKARLPEGAIAIAVGPDGFSPASLNLPANKKITLAITRSAEPNCASRIVFPSLGITREAEPGETVIIEIPPQPAGELRFSCGMKMLKGVLILETR